MLLQDFERVHNRLNVVTSELHSLEVRPDPTLMARAAPACVGHVQLRDVRADLTKLESKVEAVLVRRMQSSVRQQLVRSKRTACADPEPNACQTCSID